MAQALEQTENLAGMGFLAYIACFFISMLLSKLLTSNIVKNKVRIERADDRLAVQSSHVGEPLRLGGVSILTAVAIGCILLPVSWAIYLIIATGMISFVAGIWEDLTGKVSAKRRLAVSMVASLTLAMLLGIWQIRTDLPELDIILSKAPFISIFLVLFASSGFTHAFNLIDGMNGLAVATAITSSSCLAIINFAQGDIALTNFLFYLVASLLGLVIFNWPRGSLFLGDGGAYFLGHAIFWSAALTLFRNSEVSVSAIILILFWPIADLILTVFRRIISGKNVGSPDRMHFHQVVRRGIEIVIGGKKRRQLSNPLTTLFLLPCIVVPAISGVVFYKQAWLATVSLVIFSTVYVLTYAVLKRKMANIYSRRLLAPDTNRERL